MYKNQTQFKCIIVNYTSIKKKTKFMVSNMIVNDRWNFAADS